MRKIQGLRRPYRFKRKKSFFKSRFFGISILLLVIIGGLVYLFVFSSVFQVEQVKVFGSFPPPYSKISEQDIQSLISNEVGNRFLSFSSRTIFLVDLDRIDKLILEEFPQIKQVKLQRDLPHILTAEIEWRKAVAVFCYNQQYFLMDGEGVVFEESIEPEPLQLFIRDLNLTGELKLGEEVISPELLSRLLQIKSELNESLKISIQEISVVSGKRLNVRTSEGWDIYFNPSNNLDWQFTELDLLLKKEISPERRETLEYIDLRFERAYYK